MLRAPCGSFKHAVSQNGISPIPVGRDSGGGVASRFAIGASGLRPPLGSQRRGRDDQPRRVPSYRPGHGDGGGGGSL